MGIILKNKQEIEEMRVAGQLAAEVLRMIAPHVQPGVTTGELDRVCHDYITGTQEAIPGDRLIPETVDIPLNFYPKAPSANIDGRIISVAGGVTQIGQYMVVVVNRGTRDGLAVGDVLTVWEAGDKIDDRFGGGRVRLPDEEAGTLMVFKVYDRIGLGLIMEATEAIHIHDHVRNPT